MGYFEETKRVNTNISALYDTGGYKSMNENCGQRRNKACADVYTGSKYAIGFSSNKVSHDDSAKSVEPELNLTFQVKYGRGAFNSKIKSTRQKLGRGFSGLRTQGGVARPGLWVIVWTCMVNAGSYQMVAAVTDVLKMH